MTNVNEFKFRRRNPILVIFWALGLLILMQMVQYPAIGLASLMSNHSFEDIISGQYEDHLTIFGQGLMLMIVGIPFVFLVLKYLWKRKKEWLGIKFLPGKLASGTVLGLFFPMIIVVILYFFNTVRIAEYPERLPIIVLSGALVGYLATYLFGAIVEEVIFRAIITRELAERWGWPAAAVISGFVFGAMHISNLTSPDLLMILTLLWIMPKQMKAQMF